MKRFLLALLMAIMVLYPTVRAHGDLKSITPLVYDGWNVCTTFSINSSGTWLTDYHCVSHLSDMKQLMIGDQHARPMISWAADDLVLLKTDVGAPALRFASQAPEVGDTVRMLGYIDGSSTWAYSQGVVMNAHYKMHDKAYIVSGIPDTLTNRNFLLAAMPSCKGHSGSPIGNEAYEIVSILQLVPGHPCAPVSYGPTWERLMELLKTHITAKEA